MNWKYQVWIKLGYYMDIQWRVIFFIKILLPTLKKHICVSADTKKKESIFHKFQKLDLDKVVDINFLACSYEVFNSKNYGF